MSEKLVAVAIHDAQVCTTRTVKFEFGRIVHREHGPMLAGPFNGRRHVRCQNCFWRYLFVAEESVKTLELCFCCQDLRETFSRLRRQAAHDSPCAKVQTTVAQIDRRYVLDNCFHAFRRVIHASSRSRRAQLEQHALSMSGVTASGARAINE